MVSDGFIQYTNFSGRLEYPKYCLKYIFYPLLTDKLILL